LLALLSTIEPLNHGTPDALGSCGVLIHSGEDQAPM
jgi:hypothetical protein